MDLQKDEECHLFLRSYFIFDVATKRIPLKAEHRRRRLYATVASPSRCFYVPDVLLLQAPQANLHRTQVSSLMRFQRNFMHENSQPINCGKEAKSQFPKDMLIGTEETL